VHGDVQAGALLQVVQRLADLLDRLVGAVEGRALDRDDADRVLVADLTASSGESVNRLPSIGTSRISTSQ
jgi:hypothetical protein